MNKKILCIALSTLFLLNHCSFVDNSKIWTGDEEEIKRVAELEAESKIKTSKIYSTDDNFKEEIQINKRIFLDEPTNNKSWSMSKLNLQNSTGNLYLPSSNNRFLSKKVGKDRFNILQKIHSPIFFDNNILVADDSGFIKKINKKGSVYWKTNVYEKIYKKLPKNITFSLADNKIYAADNIGFIYVINYKTGNVIWKKNYGIPFKSNIKIFENKIFIINQDNTIFCINSTNGKTIWDVSTIDTFIKSQNLLGLAISKSGNLFALNTGGDVLKIDAHTGNVIWSMNSLTSLTEFGSDFFKSSDLVLNQNDLIFSSASSTYSLNANNGYINWMVKPTSSNTPIVVNNNVFLVTDFGYFVNLDRVTGQIIFSKNILKSLKKKKQKTEISGYVMGSNKIYVTTLNGYLIICTHLGEVESFKKIANSINTGPIVANGELYILTSKSKILGFN